MSRQRDAYLVPANASNVALACTADTLEWTSADVSVEGDFYADDAPLDVSSESHVFDPDVDSTLYFVAVTYDALDREVNRGECGDPDETLGLKGQKLIASGADMTPGIIVFAASLAIGGGALVVRRRRR